MSEETIDDLRAERDRLAKALAECSIHGEEVSKEFEQFSQTVSHDLRAPLRAVEGFGQILLEDHASTFEGEARQCVESMTNGARNASALIEDLAAYSRLCRSPFQPCVIDMQRLAGQKADELKTGGATAAFRIDALPAAWGDLAMLDALMEELLRNAVKFSRRQAHPSIEITGLAEPGRSVYTVRDNGVGFDPRYAHRLFGVFQRLHETKDFEGRGIGLAKVKRLAHRHGGKVWAEGQPNAGAAFSFSLPLRPL